MVVPMDWLRVGGAANLGQPGPAVRCPGEKDNTFLGISAQWDSLQGWNTISIPSSLSEPGCGNTLSSCSVSSLLGSSWALTEKRQRSVQAESPVSLLTVEATEGQTHPHLSEDPCPGCQPTQGQREAPSSVKKGKENHFIFRWGNKPGAGCFPGGGVEPTRPPLVQGGPLLPTLPSCTFKMEGPQTPSSGATVATAWRQPSQPRASAECNKNSLAARAENTDCGRGLECAAMGCPALSPRAHCLSLPIETLVAAWARL